MGKKSTDCVLCGTQFEYYRSDKPGLYCSDCVKNEAWRTVPEPPTGPDNPLWNGGKVDLVCPICGTEFDRFPSEVNDGVNLCSNACRAAWLSDAFRGEGHPNWKGGGNEEYGTGWGEVRGQALERDGYRCVVCSETMETMGRKPDVHHIESVRTFIESEKHSVEDAHRLDNVISLCISCHRKAEFGKIPKSVLWELIADPS